MRKIRRIYISIKKNATTLFNVRRTFIYNCETPNGVLTIGEVVGEVARTALEPCFSIDMNVLTDN
jgi:hypothetical protein